MKNNPLKLLKTAQNSNLIPNIPLPNKPSANA